MRRSSLLACLMALLCVAPASAQPAATDPAPAVEAPVREKELRDEYIIYDGKTLVLAYDASSEATHMREYIPAGETLENWKTMAAIHEYPQINDPASFIESLRQTIAATNPKAQSATRKNEKTGEVMIDFVTWPDDQKFVEFDIFRARLENGHVVAEQYAQRAYGDVGTKFLKGLQPTRARLIKLMAKEKFAIKTGKPPATPATAMPKPASAVTN